MREGCGERTEEVIGLPLKEDCKRLLVGPIKDIGERMIPLSRINYESGFGERKKRLPLIRLLGANCGCSLRRY